MMKVISITVTFNPDIDLLKRQLDAVSHQVDVSIIVDNGSENIEELVLLISDQDRAELIKLDKNYGIAYAQNIGLLEAIKYGTASAYALLLDQDSIPCQNMVPQLLSGFNKTENVAAVGPVRVDIKSGIKSFFMTQINGVPKHSRPDSNDIVEQHSVEVTYLISSGTIIPFNVLDDVGCMQNEYFIDRVDTEWCFRARAKGYRLLGIPGAELYHSLGDRAFKIWDHFLVPWHKPLRHYYVFRNTLLMLKDVEIPFIWQLHAIWRLFQVGTFSLLFAPHRLRRLRFIGLGMLHGFKSVRGRLNQASLMCESIEELSHKVDF